MYCAARKMKTMRIRQSHIDFLSWLCNGHLSKWYLDMSCIIQIERLYHPTFIWYHHSRRIATTRPSRQGHKEPVTGSKLRPRSNFHPLTSKISLGLDKKPAITHTDDILRTLTLESGLVITPIIARGDPGYTTDNWQGPVSWHARISLTALTDGQAT